MTPAGVSISESTFAIFTNGFADGPAQALRDHLLANDAAAVTVVQHPLVSEGDVRHRIEKYRFGSPTTTRAISLPFRPPYTYPLDLLLPLWPEKVDVWFGFNNLMAARGVVARRAGRAKKVVYWCVDFVPERFGSSPITRIYDGVDRWCCRHVDARFELSNAAAEGRDARHQLAGTPVAPSHIVPMGAWLDRTPQCSERAWHSPRIVYMGHLVPRQGVHVLIDALGVLVERGAPLPLDVVGRGPAEPELRARVVELGLERWVKFHGFVEDHRDVEAILAGATLAAATYDPGGNTFTRFADPGKLKAYMAAGLPVVMTDVPPNAVELVAHAGAELVEFNARAVADGILRVLATQSGWRERRQCALHHAASYDWRTILSKALAALGYGSAAGREVDR